MGGKTETFQVSDLPVEVTGPENVSVPLNGSASLSVSARVNGAEEQGPFTWSYQWYRRTGGSYEPIQGAEEATYQLPENVTGQAGGICSTGVNVPLPRRTACLSPSSRRTLS